MSPLRSAAALLAAAVLVLATAACLSQSAAEDRRGGQQVAAQPPNPGQLANFTGIASPYEAPEHPEVRIDTTAVPAEAAADEVIAQLRRVGIID